MEGEEKTQGDDVSKPAPAVPVQPEQKPQEAAVAPAPIPPPVPSARAEDKLYGGNIVEEAQKKPDAPDATPAGAASARALRELGLAPRKDAVATTESAAPSADTIKSAAPIPSIRTYAADVGEVIRKRGESLASIVNAEQGRRSTNPRTSPEERVAGLQRTVLIAGAGFLVLAGVAVIAGVFLFSKPDTPVNEYTPLISANASVLIPVTDGADLPALLGAERIASDLNLGETAEVVIMRGTARMSPSEILGLLGAPSALARNATDIFVGIHAYNRNQPFILIEVSEYDRAFESMLSWEPSLAEDLGTFFAPVRSIHTPPPATLTFSDRVYQNIDVRVSQTDWQIVYAFPSRNLLLITTNDSTVREVLTRLALSAR